MVSLGTAIGPGAGRRRRGVPATAGTGAPELSVDQGRTSARLLPRPIEMPALARSIEAADDDDNIGDQPLRHRRRHRRPRCPNRVYTGAQYHRPSLSSNTNAAAQPDRPATSSVSRSRHCHLCRSRPTRRTTPRTARPPVAVVPVIAADHGQSDSGPWASITRTTMSVACLLLQPAVRRGRRRAGV